MGNSNVYRGFRYLLVMNLSLSFPFILLPVGSALKIYRAHPLLAYPFTLLNIFDLLFAFGYVIFYVPFLYMRATGVKVDSGVSSGSIAMTMLIYIFKMVFQTMAYSTIHRCIEQMSADRFDKKYSLDSLHDVLNLMACVPERMIYRKHVDIAKALRGFIKRQQAHSQTDEEAAAGSGELATLARLFFHSWMILFEFEFVSLS